MELNWMSLVCLNSYPYIYLNVILVVILLAFYFSVGKHNGLYKGVKYFECRINHGVFVRASSLRFIKNVKRR